MFFNPESGSRKTDIEAARAAEGVAETTRFINYGKPGDQPTEAALRDIWTAWADQGVTGTSEVPAFKTHPVHNFGLDVTVSEAVEAVKTHADEAAGTFAVSMTVERLACEAQYDVYDGLAIETVRLAENSGLTVTEEAA